MLRLILSLLFLISCTALAADREQTEKELKQLKQQIEQQKQLISQQKLDKKSLQQQLKTSELAIAKSAKALTLTKASLNENKQQVKVLEEQQEQLSAAHKKQQLVLAKQLKSAYMAGKHDFGKLLLNQQEFSKLERVISYYKYLNEARVENIEKIKQTAEKLAVVNRSLLEEKGRLTELLFAQQTQQEKLNLQQKSRRQTLRALNKQISSDQQQLAKLQEDEKALVQLLERVRELINTEITLSGLKSFRGTLPWPTKGRVRHKFGHRKQGQVKWKGLYIEGKEGANVHTIHQGRVLYADWLKGFGLLMVIDHGDGYMSLYGHNQALLKTAGETVEAGEPIALLGQSGGKSRAGLYFEIRHRGRPINPSRWLGRS